MQRAGAADGVPRLLCFWEEGKGRNRELSSLTRHGRSRRLPAALTPLDFFEQEAKRILCLPGMVFPGRHVRCLAMGDA